MYTSVYIITMYVFNFFPSPQFEARDFSHLPPEQRKKKLVRKINELDNHHNKLISDKLVLQTCLINLFNGDGIVFLGADIVLALVFLLA